MALRVNSFQGMQNLPLVVAMRRGLLAEAGLDVSLSLTNSSAAQLAGLATGRYDLIHTAPDNVINYDSDPQAFGLDPATTPRATLLMGGSNGPLTLYTRPGIERASQIAGQPVGVDNPSSGFALVLRDLLARAGLELERDFTFTTAGSTASRARQLVEGAFAATILYPPFDRLAEAAGCRAQASSTTTYPAYSSQALAATESWVAEHPELLTRYISALLRALRWVHDPAARPSVTALIASEPDLGALNADPASALAAFTDPRTGYGERAALDDAGLTQVIALRARYGAPTSAPLGAPADYHDLRAYQRALVSMTGERG